MASEVSSEVMFSENDGLTFENNFAVCKVMGYIHSYHTSFYENKKKIVLKLPLRFIEYV